MFNLYAKRVHISTSQTKLQRYCNKKKLAFDAESKADREQNLHPARPSIFAESSTEFKSESDKNLNIKKKECDLGCCIIRSVCAFNTTGYTKHKAFCSMIRQCFGRHLRRCAIHVIRIQTSGTCTRALVILQTE